MYLLLILLFRLICIFYIVFIFVGHGEIYILFYTNIAAKFTPGFLVLFDKGFNVQDLFLSPSSKMCVITIRTQLTTIYTRSEVCQGKRIARARIHIERVMDRLNEFDVCDKMFVIIFEM